MHFQRIFQAQSLVSMSCEWGKGTRQRLSDTSPLTLNFPESGIRRIFPWNAQGWNHDRVLQTWLDCRVGVTLSQCRGAAELAELCLHPAVPSAPCRAAGIRSVIPAVKKERTWALNPTGGEDSLAIIPFAPSPNPSELPWTPSLLLLAAQDGERCCHSSPSPFLVV